jgi:hypothetical protein
MKIFILLLSFCMAQATLPEVLIGKGKDMIRVSVIQLRDENTWAFVIPSEKQLEFRNNYMSGSYDNAKNIEENFDPDKINTYSLLFPHNSPQANLNVALGGQPLQDKDAYFAVHYKKEGKEWLPKIMMCESIKNDVYAIWKLAKDTYTFNGRAYNKNAESRPGEREFTMQKLPNSNDYYQLPYSRDYCIYRIGGGGQTAQQWVQKEQVATTIFKEMRISSKASYVFIVPFVTFIPKYAKYAPAEREELVYESIMALLKKGDPKNLLGYQRPKTLQLTQLPEVLIGADDSMKVAVVGLEKNDTWALVVPSAAQTWFIAEQMRYAALDDPANAANNRNTPVAKIEHIAKNFDPKKVTTYWLLFPHDTPHAKLNVKLGRGSRLIDEDYFAVPYQEEGTEWLPKFMTRETKSYTYYTSVAGYYELNIPIKESETIVQTKESMGSKEEIATIALERKTITAYSLHRSPRGNERHCRHVEFFSIVPIVTFNPKYADQKDRLKLVEESIMELYRKGDPEDLLGLQRTTAAIQAKELMALLPFRI